MANSTMEYAISNNSGKVTVLKTDKWHAMTPSWPTDSNHRGEEHTLKMDFNVLASTCLPSPPQCLLWPWPSKSKQVISGVQQLFSVSFIEIAEVVHEVWCSQDLTWPASCDLDLW